MAYYFDVSKNFDLDGKGNLVVLEDEDAINQALKTFISLAAGEYVYFPGSAGFTQDLVFKNINTDNIESYRFQLSNLLRDNFYPQVTVLDLRVSVDNSNRLVFALFYQINATGQTQELTLTKTRQEIKIEPIIKQDVDYIDTNLENFVLSLLDVEEMKTERLIINNNTGKWEWGKFVLTNFSTSSTNFATILGWING